jgi:hypothetical protein
LSRLFSFALFFTLMLTVLGGAHYYAWTRLVRDLSLPPGQQRTLTVALTVLFALVPLSFFVRRTNSLLATPVVWVSSAGNGKKHC